MALKNVLAPPTMTDGNPLSAFGVNQLVEATNFYGQQVFGNNTAWQKFVAYGSLSSSENRFVLVNKYDNLYINIYHTVAYEPLKVYARKAGAGQTTYQLYSSNVTPVSNVTELNIDLSTNPGGFSISPNEVYFIFLDWTNNSGSEMGMVQNLYEYETSIWSTPSISTLTASTVISASYLNSLITPVKALSELDVSTNFGFSGIKTNQNLNQSNTYARWQMVHKNRYLHIGARIINEAVLRIYLNDQLIETETKTTATTEDFVYLYDMNTIATDLGITAPAIGDLYEIKFRFDDSAGTPPFLRANFVWELPTP